MHPPRISSPRQPTAALVAAVLPQWRGELTAFRIARVLRRPIGEVRDALMAMRSAGKGPANGR